jgi:hypothetical protein
MDLPIATGSRTKTVARIAKKFARPICFIPKNFAARPNKYSQFELLLFALTAFSRTAKFASKCNLPTLW